MPETHKASVIFTLAKRAAWAGDVEYCRDRLDELEELTRGRGEPNDGDPLTLISRAAKHIEAHLAGKDAPPGELVIERSHLRGVVWQVDRREFELLAYLTDYSWEETLYRNAAAAAAMEHVTVLDPEEDDDIYDETKVERQKDLFPQEKPAPAVDEGMGLSWEEYADGLECVVTVGDLGLIKAKGLWLGRDMPQSADEVVLRFQRILERIESPDRMRLDLKNSNKGSE